MLSLFMEIIEVVKSRIGPFYEGSEVGSSVVETKSSYSKMQTSRVPTARIHRITDWELRCWPTV